MSSKFAAALAAARQREPEPEEQDQAPEPPRFSDAVPAPAVVASEEARPVGRPRTGKRSNPAYTQVSALVRQETLTRVKVALLVEGGKRDLSELVESLLGEWLEKRS